MRYQGLVRERSRNENAKTEAHEKAKFCETAQTTELSREGNEIEIGEWLASGGFSEADRV